MLKLKKWDNSICIALYIITINTSLILEYLNAINLNNDGSIFKIDRIDKKLIIFKIKLINFRLFKIDFPTK
jgi:hypothetical protein